MLSIVLFLPYLFHFSLTQTCGDIHPNSLEHFCALVEEVMVPILRNDGNMSKFPQCISEGSLMIVSYNLNLFLLADIKKQVHELSTSVYQIRGYIKGKTLLPFPQVVLSGTVSVLQPTIGRARPT